MNEKFVKKIRVQTRWDAANIPKKYLNLPNEKIDKSLLFSSLFIFGKTGTGKTKFLVNLAREQIAQSAGLTFPPNIPYARYLSWFDFIGRLEMEWDKEKKKKILEEVIEVEYLYLDDFNPIDFNSNLLTKSTMYRLITNRTNNETKTIISSNFSLDDLEDKIGVDLTRKISEMGPCLELEKSKNENK